MAVFTKRYYQLNVLQGGEDSIISAAVEEGTIVDEIAQITANLPANVTELKQIERGPVCYVVHA